MAGVLIDGLIIWSLLIYFGRFELEDWPFGIAHAFGIMIINVVLSSLFTSLLVLLPCIIAADGFYLMYMCDLTLKQAGIAVSAIFLWNLLFSMILLSLSSG